MTIPIIPDQCTNCDHYRSFCPGIMVPVCEAFPLGIPNDILIGDFDHKESHSNDGGILFEPISKQLNYGTSEGAIAGWDTRGRGRKEEEKSNKSVFTKEISVDVFYFPPNIDKFEAQMIFEYTNASYNSINRYLVNAKDFEEFPSETIEKLEKRISLLDSAINKNPLIHEADVYRGLSSRVADEFIKNGVKHEGVEIECKPFLSTSLSPHEAYSFAVRKQYHSDKVYLMEIKLPKGSKAISTIGNSTHDSEREILVGRGIVLQSKGYREENYYSGQKVGIFSFEAKL